MLRQFCNNIKIVYFNSVVVRLSPIHNGDFGDFFRRL